MLSFAEGLVTTLGILPYTLPMVSAIERCRIKGDIRDAKGIMTHRDMVPSIERNSQYKPRLWTCCTVRIKPPPP